MLRQLLSFSSLVLTGAILLTACGKKEEAESAPVPAAKTAPGAPAAPEVKTEAVAVQETQVMPELNFEPIANPTLEAAEAATKRKEYDRAAVALMQIQNNPKLSEQQSWAAQAQMKTLQRDLASAAAAGDKRAQQAIQLLRSTTPR